jgi:hypothetical protein
MAAILNALAIDITWVRKSTSKSATPSINKLRYAVEEVLRTNKTMNKTEENRSKEIDRTEPLPSQAAKVSGNTVTRSWASTDGSSVAEEILPTPFRVSRKPCPEAEPELLKM